jgi:hypothetical protein
MYDLNGIEYMTAVASALNADPELSSIRVAGTPIFLAVVGGSSCSM